MTTVAPPTDASARSPALLQQRALWWWLLGLAVVALWFGVLDHRHLLRSDEGRYAQIAREMWASGDWVTIRYQGLKYFEKPPLHLWMTALAYSAFGVGEWQARLWVALCGALATLATVLALRRWHGPAAGWLGGLVLLATPSWVIAGHFNSLDMGVAAAMTCALAAFLIAQHPAQDAAARRRWMLLAWAMVGAAVLSKGLIGIVLPGGALVLYTLVTRDWALWRRLHLVTGTLVLLVVAAPWFVLVSLRNPEFPQFFFIHEHFARYTSQVHLRGAPWWFFVPQLLGGFLPWLALTPRWLPLLRPAPQFNPDLFCGLWAAVIFVFFSLSGSKLPGYIVPLFPPLAWLAARALQTLDARGWRLQLGWMSGCLLLGLAGTVGVVKLGSTPGLRHYGLWLLAACVLGLAGLALAWLWQRRGRLQASIAAAGLAVYAAATLGLLGHEVLGRPSSGVDLVPAIRARLQPDTVLYGVRLLDHTLPFYLQRTLVMVEDPDELEFGTQQEPARWVPSLAAFRPLWEQGPAALAVMSPQTYETLRADGWRLLPVARDERRVVVANREAAAQ
jgi:4-amino-4-deoxy-L-arabinose transferase-like glycosyltransferase